MKTTSRFDVTVTLKEGEQLRTKNSRGTMFYHSKGDQAQVVTENADMSVSIVFPADYVIEMAEQIKESRTINKTLRIVRGEK